MARDWYSNMPKSNGSRRSPGARSLFDQIEALERALEKMAKLASQNTAYLPIFQRIQHDLGVAEDTQAHLQRALKRRSCADVT